MLWCWQNQDFYYLYQKIGFFYNCENNDNDNNDKDYSHNHANNHNNYDNKMKFRSSKPTEDPLCSKKEKDKII